MLLNITISELKEVQKCVRWVILWASEFTDGAGVPTGCEGPEILLLCD